MFVPPSPFSLSILAPFALFSMAIDPGPLGRFEEMTKDAETSARNMAVIVQRVAEGETLKQLAVVWEVPYGRLAQWIVEDRDRSEQYVAAKALCEAARADEVHEIAERVGDKLELGKAALRIKAIQWAASKWNPARFGDRVELNANVRDDRLPADRDMMLLEAARGLAFILARAGRVQPKPAELRLIEAPKSDPDEGII